MNDMSIAIPSVREIVEIPCSSVRYVKELYPRLKPHDALIERYRDAIDNLPPITVARDGILVDGYHRWQSHVRENRETIKAENLGNLSDAEIWREAIKSNAIHGEQLSIAEKKKEATKGWANLAHLSIPERIEELSQLFSVSRDAIERWTKDARTEEKKAAQERAYDLWLDCYSQREIADVIGKEYPAFSDITQQTICNWLDKKSADAENLSPPDSRQHFDIWQFTRADKDAGSQSYFGALPPQVLENLLWFYTEPSDIVVDLFAGSGTTIDVAKEMGRRVWASDIRGDYYSPHLPIHTHDATMGWPNDAPSKAELVFLDPPYWKQASGRYSTEPSEMAEMDLEAFNAAWSQVVASILPRAARVAYIISPTQNEDGSVIDHATIMLAPFFENSWRIERRIIVPYQTQQATGQQVTWARDNKRMLKLYRDLVVLTK